MPYIADVAGWRPVVAFSQHSVSTRKPVVAPFLPEVSVYRHNVALCGKDVLVIGFVQRVVFIKQLQCNRDRMFKYYSNISPSRQVLIFAAIIIFKLL